MANDRMTASQHLNTAEAFLAPEHDTPEETVTQFAIIACGHALAGLLRIAIDQGLAG